MHDSPSSIPFDLTGGFGGVILTEAGKHRLLLHVGEAERLFKVPRWMRRRLVGNYRLGQPIRVRGTGERDPLTGQEKWKVAEVLPLAATVPPEPAAMPLPAGPVRVCAKKTCWRQGGRELFAALEQGIKARGLEDHLRVKAVNCLDRCKQGPNIDWGDHEFSRCRPADVTAILDRAASQPGPALQD